MIKSNTLVYTRYQFSITVNFSLQLPDCSIHYVRINVLLALLAYGGTNFA
jgi:hypothetical protein